MSRAIILLLGTAAYIFFFATFLYLITFVGNLPWVPVTIDRGPDTNIGAALLINLALVAAFGLQHSIMARPSFKAAWTRVVPKALERSVYVVAASVMLILLMAVWRPITAPLPRRRSGLGWGISPRSPTEQAGWRTGCRCCGHTGLQRGGSR